MRASKLSSRAEELGVTEVALVADALNQSRGVVAAASLLEVTTPTLYLWLARNGYTVEPRVVLVPVNPPKSYRNNAPKNESRAK